MTKTGYIFFSTIGLIIVGVFFYFTSRPPEIVPPIVATSTPVTYGYTNTFYGFALNPKDLVATSTFTRSYLAVANWSLLDSAETNHGDSVVAFVVPGSNNITGAELRIGISKEKEQLTTCTTVDSSTQNIGTTTINGLAFATFALGDAAMSHFLEAKIYRTLHDGTCYSLEEVVTGSNPEVYDPPATVPFEKAEAFSKMEEAAKSFVFK